MEMNLRRFFSTAWERHRIYVLKELGVPKPWTTDPIFLDNFFCNVFRRLDKTSVWIEENAIKPNEDNPELWKTIFMCRYMSRISSLQALKNNDALIGNQQKAHDLLRHWVVNGAKIFTNAFIVNSHTSEGWSDKVTYMFRLLRDVKLRFDGDPDAAIKEIKTMREMFETLNGLPGVGNFMAYQYTVDFTYSQRYLARAEDKHEWTCLGLGACRGLNRLLGNMPKRSGIKDDDQLALSREILGAWRQEIADHMYDEVQKTSKHAGIEEEDDVINLYRSFEHVAMSDVEHELCEYDKYMRGGSKKRRYDGN